VHSDHRFMPVPRSAGLSGSRWQAVQGFAWHEVRGAGGGRSRVDPPFPAWRAAGRSARRGRSRRIVRFLTALGAALTLAVAVPAAAAEPTAAATGEHGGEHHGVPALNWFDFTNRHTAPVLALVVNFAILVWLLAYLGRPRLRDFLSARQRKVQEEVDAAWEEKLRSEGKLRGLEARAAHLDEELKTLREDLLRIGLDERERLLRDARERAEKIRREAEAAAREEERRARAELRRRIVEQALEEARATLRQRLTAADQSRLAEEFLRQLPAQEAQPR